MLMNTVFLRQKYCTAVAVGLFGAAIMTHMWFLSVMPIVIFLGVFLSSLFLTYVHNNGPFSLSKIFFRLPRRPPDDAAVSTSTKPVRPPAGADARRPRSRLPAAAHGAHGRRLLHGWRRRRRRRRRWRRRPIPTAGGNGTSSVLRPGHGLRRIRYCIVPHHFKSEQPLPSKEQNTYY